MAWTRTIFFPFERKIPEKTKSRTPRPTAPPPPPNPMYFDELTACSLLYSICQQPRTYAIIVQLIRWSYTVLVRTMWKHHPQIRNGVTGVQISAPQTALRELHKYETGEQGYSSQLHRQHFVNYINMKWGNRGTDLSSTDSISWIT
jgi:hypothetical protein